MIVRSVQPELHGEPAVGIKSGVPSPPLGEGRNHQPGSCQQDQRQGEFTDHQALAKSRAARAGCCPALSRFKHLVEIKVCRKNGWRQSREGTGQNGNQKSKTKYPAVQMNVVQTRQIKGRYGKQRPETRTGKSQTESAPSESDYHAFR